MWVYVFVVYLDKTYSNMKSESCSINVSHSFSHEKVCPLIFFKLLIIMDNVFRLPSSLSDWRTFINSYRNLYYRGSFYRSNKTIKNYIMISDNKIDLTKIVGILHARYTMSWHLHSKVFLFLFWETCSRRSFEDWHVGMIGCAVAQNKRERSNEPNIVLHLVLWINTFVLFLLNYILKMCAH